MVVLKCVMSGDCQQLRHGKNRVGSTLHKSHYVSFLESFRPQLFPVHGF